MGNGNPFEGTAAAFGPLMGETVGLRGTRKGGREVATSFMASVFPVEDTDPLSEADVETDVRRIEVIATPDARIVKPQVGDTLTLEDGTEWNVSEVSNSLEFLKVIARGSH